jgi:hypothetical protein
VSTKPADAISSLKTRTPTAPNSVPKGYARILRENFMQYWLMAVKIQTHNPCKVTSSVSLCTHLVFIGPTFKISVFLLPIISVL